MKARATKLQEHAEQLASWFRESPPVTLAEARARLQRLHGLSVSESRLSTWWSEQETRRAIQQAQDTVLSSIARGAQLNRTITSAQAKDAPPEMLTIIGLLKTMILQLSVNAADNPELLEMLPALMRPVVDWLKIQQAGQALSLQRDRFQFSAAESCLAHLPMLKSIAADSSLDSSAKVEAIRQRLFGPAPTLETAATPALTA